MKINIDELILRKKGQITTEKDKKVLEAIERICKDKSCFFNMDVETAYKILLFLGIPKDKLTSSYFELTSPEEYKKNMPAVYNFIDEDILIK